MSNCEKSMAASNWVVNRLPRDKDKVLASIGAETIGQSWMSRSEEGAGNETVRKGLEMSRKTRRRSRFSTNTTWLTRSTSTWCIRTNLWIF